MAKKKNIKPVLTVKQMPEPSPAIPVLEHTISKPWSVYDFKTQAVIISLLAFVFYFNTFFNEHAHDDDMVVVKNEYVLEGFKGVPEIFTKDAYDSYYRQYNSSNQLAGGRYRPLSIFTFAVEQQIFGAIPKDRVDSFLQLGLKDPYENVVIHNMHIRHVFNVLWFVLSMVALLYFLRYIVFRSDPIIALIATILFTINPIHTEVIANVKSRDEIMSLLFICLTFIFAFKYRELQKRWMLGVSLLCYLLAFLTKEYAITLLALLPLSFYVFDKQTMRKSIIATIPYAVVAVIYILIRLQIVGAASPDSYNDILDNPYAFATASEKLATEIATSLNYLKLLIIPYPLSADYSYNTIPYKDFSNPLVWLSLGVHLGLILGFFYFLKRRSVLCFAIAFYMLNLLMICNIFFNIGATMGERLIYHSSVGFVMAAAYLLYKAAEQIQPAAIAKKALTAFMVVVIILSGYKTIARNAEWKNDYTLFGADIKVVPNSVLVNTNVAVSYIALADQINDEKEKDGYLYNAISLLNHALSLDPKCSDVFLNRGIAWYKLGEIDKAKLDFDTVKQLYPTYPALPGMYRQLGVLYMKRGWEKYGKYGKYPEAIRELQKAIAVDAANAEIWFNMGSAYFSNHQFADAIAAWEVALRLKPDYGKARRGTNVAMQALSDPAIPDSSKVRRDSFWLSYRP